MRLAVPKENTPGETRVAIAPDTIKRLIAKKVDVSVETHAGERAFIRDDDYRAAGATVEPSADDLFAKADLVVQIHPPTLAQIAKLREGSTIISLLYPLTNVELVQALAARGVTAISADMIPRTTLAQSMDVLSSQTTAAGYHGVLLAAAALPKFFPMLMTAAGTIPPAKVLVLGAGVAGLQAIATARRLGAVVEAFDVRKAVKEQVQSLGAKFVEVEGLADAQTQGGYAKEITEDEKQKQADAIKRHIAKSDVCITTALIPGRRAPILITADMVRGMRAGSVIVDLAAEQGGNCELCKPGETIVDSGVTIIGTTNLQGKVAVDASQMYSRNMEKLVVHMLEGGALKIDLGEEITRGCVITHGGEVVNPRVSEVVTAKGAA
ncbi:MAG TPA: Re/Si-specific NAD(P)(+) transhydrogenase subunit alpha [Polyangiaceae bacterium]|nr:Re/Si-specific NAD(P)(+) transhydrogenase subunit alpha [Polyangiaceae bacterium]